MRTIGWVRFDEKEYERAERARELLETPGALDPLGLGSIREAFAEAMFPGLSTIQTRARYAFFVGWAFDANRHVRRDRIADATRDQEIATIERLREGLEQSGESARGTGLIGANSGEALVQLPSTIYWTLLRRWRSHDALSSRAQWLAALPERRLPLLPDLPGAPAPRSRLGNALTFEMPEDERHYLHAAAKEGANGTRTLFRDLLDGRATMDGNGGLEAVVGGRDSAGVLHPARAFARLTWGASIAYNILLLEARLSDRTRGSDEHEKDETLWEKRMSEWREWRGDDVAEPSHDPGTFDPARDADAVLKDGFFGIVGLSRRDQAVGFAHEWAKAVRGAKSPKDVRALIVGRERAVKGAAQRRFTSSKALQRWGGASDIGMADYRWSAAARRFLLDMNADGVRSSEAAG